MWVSRETILVLRRETKGNGTTTKILLLRHKIIDLFITSKQVEIAS